MKQEADSQGKSHIQKLCQTFGEFLRKSLADAVPSETGLQLESIANLAQTKLESALAQTNVDSNDSLYRTAATTAIETIRHNKQQLAEQTLGWVNLLDSKLPPNPEQVAQSVQKSIAQLSENRRRVVGLFLAGLTVKEISELLGWNESKAEQTLNKGLQDLQKSLQTTNIEYEID